MGLDYYIYLRGTERCLLAKDKMPPYSHQPS